ncbi:MAG TPA: MBL fold metallo-hydrolase [Solirubrobacteraceae bacterium]|nr:MBL fold metallo-hydrolase [Solirubrobacteraceae bacterium]
MPRPCADRIVFAGHATVAIDLAGTRLLTDPLLRARVAHLRRRAPLPAVEAVGAPDAVLISHLHHDHLDLTSLRLLGQSTPLVVPAGAGAWLARRGFAHTRELEVGESATVGSLSVRAVPARHDERRHPGGPRARALGYVVRSPEDSVAVYFAGDTGLFAGMAQIAPRLDLALLPVAGWGRRLGPGHMDPLEAAEAARLLAPRVAVPIHWGTLAPIGASRGLLQDHGDAPHRFAGHVARLAPAVEVAILAPGEQLALAGARTA